MVKKRELVPVPLQGDGTTGWMERCFFPCQNSGNVLGSKCFPLKIVIALWAAHACGRQPTTSGIDAIIGTSLVSPGLGR
jgi:hypothetical protein